MRNFLYGLALLLGTAIAACNSDRNTEQSSDTMLTDTASTEMNSTDSLNMVDSAVNNNTTVDSAGVGSTPAPAPQP